MLLQVTFPKMTKLVRPGASGDARVEHFTVSKAESRRTRMRAVVTGKDELVLPGRYAALFVGGEVMMSDTRMEHRSNRAVVEQARGHVLIAGLGLGMILHPIADKPEVERITVIEKSPDVIKLVGGS